MRIYWANAFFSIADRDFNQSAAAKLIAAGHAVFLPQDAGANHSIQPTPADILAADFLAIQDSDVLVACIDHEAIDAGVACEIGIAYALGRPIVGLLTDLRWSRTGDGRIYKNLFVTGCIVASGGQIVHSVADVVSALNTLVQ